jgi:putative ABC transport system permease protein
MRHRQTTLISVAGLVISLSVVLLISQWCIYEYGYDRFNVNAGRIYRLTVEENRPSEGYYRHSASCWQTWLSGIPDYYPEIEFQVELRPMMFTTVRNSGTLFRTERAFRTDSSILKMFSFSFVEGSPQTVLRADNQVIISESMAQRLFQGKNALNNIFEINTGNVTGFEKFTVTGIYKDFPADSHFHPEILVYSRRQPVTRNDVAYIYVLLREGCTIAQIKAHEDQYFKLHVPKEEQNDYRIHYTLLTDIHLKSHLDNEIETGGDIRQVRLFIYIGIGIFLIAIINYINLLLVSFDQRRRYFHINSLFGAKPRHGLQLLLFESLCIVALVYSITLLILRPLAQSLYSMGIIKVIFAGWNTSGLLISLVFLLFVMVSGIIPLFIIRIRPVNHGNYDNSELQKKGSQIINNSLLALQFAVSIVVIICSLVIEYQNNYLFSKNMGRDNPSIVFLTREFPASGSQILLLKEKLLKIPAIEDVSMCMLRPGDLVKGYDYVEYGDIPEVNMSQSCRILPVDVNFFSFFNIPFIAGGEKNYSEEENTGNYILNKAAIIKLGFDSPEKAVGTAFKIRDIGREIISGGIITGVVDDFNFASLYNPVEATIFFQKPSFQCQFFIKLNPGNINDGLDQIRKIWTDIFPDYPFNYEFLADKYDNQYRKEIVTSRLINFLSIICIMLTIIGLWGIISSMVIHKTKEIGIRKVNGAKVSSILALLNSKFIPWIIIASLIAFPAAWYIIGKWLENYSYRIRLSWWIFILAELLVVLIVISTVTIRSWCTAWKNPVEALRYE